MTLRLISGGRDTDHRPGAAAGAGIEAEDYPAGLLIEGANQIATLAGGLRRGASQSDIAGIDAEATRPGSASGPVVAIWHDRIAAVGSRDAVVRMLSDRGLSLDDFATLDARDGAITPGLVDPHTHLLFGGSRERELVLRQKGAGYLEILAAGGGILSTVAATRQADDEALAGHGRRWLAEMLSHGTTTIEAKSGYGLDRETELRLLEVAARLGQEGPVEIVPTFLGAHAVPAEFRDRPNSTDAYVEAVIEDQLPAVAAQGRARYCDVFCEDGVFSAAQSRRILEAAARLGLALRLHADELAPSGGAELAASLGAHSADHLASPSEAGIAALAGAAAGDRPVVATLLPATTWFLMSDHWAPARRMIDAGVPVALGTDFNPGTSPTTSLPLVMTVACLGLRLSPAEVLTATTINAAHAVGLGNEIGSLEAGKQADVVIWNVPSAAQIPYWPGANLVRAVIKRGRVVYGSP
jgi:imidazolonepropionase